MKLAAERLDQLRAWVVTGPLGRGACFAIDFGGLLRTLLARRRAKAGAGRFL